MVYRSIWKPVTGNGNRWHRINQTTCCRYRISNNIVRAWQAVLDSYVGMYLVCHCRRKYCGREFGITLFMISQGLWSGHRVWVQILQVTFIIIRFIIALTAMQDTGGTVIAKNNIYRRNGNTGADWILWYIRSWL